jgi:hypothetical protein
VIEGAVDSRRLSMDESMLAVELRLEKLSRLNKFTVS